MSEQLRAAAKRLAESAEAWIASQDADPEYHDRDDVTHWRDQAAVARACLAAPAWHASPPVPGWYVIIGREWVNKDPVFHHVLPNQPNQPAFLWYARYRWFGPIPPDSEAGR